MAAHRLSTSARELRFSAADFALPRPARAAGWRNKVREAELAGGAAPAPRWAAARGAGWHKHRALLRKECGDCRSTRLAH